MNKFAYIVLIISGVFSHDQYNIDAFGFRILNTYYYIEDKSTIYFSNYYERKIPDFKVFSFNVRNTSLGLIINYGNYKYRDENDWILGSGFYLRKYLLDNFQLFFLEQKIDYFYFSNGKYPEIPNSQPLEFDFSSLEIKKEYYMSIGLNAGIKMDFKYAIIEVILGLNYYLYDHPESNKGGEFNLGIPLNLFNNAQ